MSDDPEAKADRKLGKAPKRLRPTVIEPPAKRAKSPRSLDAPRTSAPVVTTPTAIPGIERKRPTVSPADMARLSPDATPRTAARAVRLVEGFVVEGAGEQHVAQWGHAAQQRCAALVADASALARPELVDQARDYVARIAERLGAIDIQAIRDAAPSPLFGLLDPASDRIDTPRKLAAARAELLQIIGLAQAALGPLLSLKASLDDHARRIDEASFEVEAAALAALFLSEHLASSWPELSRRFLQREISLTETAVDIRAGQFDRARRIADPDTLIAKIQNVVLASLPDWLGGLARLAGPTRRGLNPVEVEELQHRLRVILRNLEA